MTRVSVPERGLETLFGNQDENLRFLEETFKVRIKNQGSDLLIEGDERGSALAGQVFEQLSSLMKDGYAVASADVRLAAQLLDRDGETRLRRLPAEGRGARRQEGGRPAQPQPAGLPRRDREERHGLRDRPRRDREDLPRGGPGRLVPAQQAGDPRDPGPPGGRGRREAGLPARGPAAEGRPLPAAALRRPLRPDRVREGGAAVRAEPDRGGPDRLHARDGRSRTPSSSSTRRRTPPPSR